MPDEAEVKICQVCGGSIQSGPIVTCKDCDTPHHRDCWDYLGQCSTYGCSSTFKRKGAVKDNAPAIYIGEKSIDLAETTEEYSAQEVIEPEEPATMLKEARDFTQYRHGRFMRVDLNTPLENFVLFSILVTFSFFIASLRGFFGPSFIFYSALLAIALSLVYWKLDCTYVLDNVSRIVYFFRRFGRFTSRRPICGYGDIECVATRGFRRNSKHSVSWRYDIVFVLKNGFIVPVSPTHNEYDSAEKEARALARHVGAPFKRNGKERELIVSYRYMKSKKRKRKEKTKALAPQKELVVAYEEYSLFNHPLSLLCLSIFSALVLLIVLL